MNIKAVVSAAALLTMTALSGAAIAQTGPAPMQGMQGPMMRGQHASNHNIRAERRRLGRIIDSLQHDEHDYGGHRVKAIELLQHARAELDQAIEYDKAHPGT
jgi:hypothetical protein